ncbi:phage tail sheath family protein [Phormidium tenue FACHB-1052]|nr:phage tail sheath family protein [Phormidium tenue FACHB-1052]
MLEKPLVNLVTIPESSPAIEYPVGTTITDAIATEIVSRYSGTAIKVESANLPYLEEEIKDLKLAPVNEPKLCANFGDFKAYFGDFSLDPGQNILAHAVYGFFRNGGTRCYVVRVLDKDKDDLGEALEAFEAIDDIAIVAAPGITATTALKAIDDHCKQKTTLDRVAIFDSPETVENAQKRLDTTKLIPGQGNMPSKSDYAAYYFPWIKVFDPVEKLKNPAGDGLKAVPPSGHMAGIYARVDSQRGVHKAPANEPVLGAVDVKYAISKGIQASLNNDGINCIRNLNGSLLVWGARTLGGNANGEFKYINVRRLMNYLRESIDEGTQWVVFEPNSPELWARIRREISAFLTTVWRSGALFGDTPDQAFYIKCNAETNPPANRDNGVVVAEIGVAIVRPAEFVVFSISQWAGAGN